MRSTAYEDSSQCTSEPWFPFPLLPMAKVNSDFHLREPERLRSRSLSARATLMEDHRLSRQKDLRIPNQGMDQLWSFGGLLGNRELLPFS